MQSSIITAAVVPTVLPQVMPAKTDSATADQNIDTSGDSQTVNAGSPFTNLLIKEIAKLKKENAHASGNAKNTKDGNSDGEAATASPAGNVLDIIGCIQSQLMAAQITAGNVLNDKTTAKSGTGSAAEVGTASEIQAVSEIPIPNSFCAPPAAENAPTEKITGQSQALPASLPSEGNTIVLASDVTPQNGEKLINAVALSGNSKPISGQLKEPIDGTDVPLSSGGMAEKIVMTLKAMSNSSSADTAFSGETFTETSPDKKNISGKTQVAAAPAEEGSAIAAPQINIPTAGEDSDVKVAAVTHALKSFVKDFKSADGDGREIKIVLEPESLGKLTIMVSHVEDGISARIKSEDKGLCAIITNQIQNLVQSMQDKGINVKNVDVLFGQAGQDFVFSQNAGNGSQNGQAYEFQQRYGGDVSSGKPEQFNFWNEYQENAGVQRGTEVEYRI